MAYIGTGGQFDPGLTNPSRQMPGRLPIQPGMGNPDMKPIGTKPLPITPPITGGGGVTGVGNLPPTYLGQPQSAVSAGSWPWPTTPTTPTSPINPNATNGVTPGSKGVPQKQQGPGVAPLVPGPPIPTGGQTAGPISGAPAGQYYGYTPEKWKPSDIDIPEAGVNTRDIVAALKPRLEEEMAAGMGDAARRFGALGGLKGTGYATTLGASERKMFEDLNALNYKYDYDAAQQDANRKSTARENTLDRELSGYGTYGGLMSDEASRHTNYGVDQQKIANDVAKNNQSVQNQGVQINNKQDWDEYMAGLSEAQRKQIYDQMMLDYGK